MRAGRIIFIALLFMWAYCQTSCNVVKKNYNKHKSETATEKKVDSVGVTKKHEEKKDTVDSSNVSTDKKDESTDVIIEFGAEDDSTGTTTVIGTDTIKTTGKKPKKIIYSGKRSAEKKDSTGISKNTSAVKDEVDSVQKKSNETTTTAVVDIDKNKKSTRLPIGIILIIGAAGISVIALLWLVGLPKTKKKEDGNS